jgi:Polyketide cyclase / dehydrase and lipid transport
MLGVMAGSLSCRVERPSSADPASVYDALMDVERWPDWMPNIVAASWERGGAPDTGEGGIRRTRMRTGVGRALNLREQIIGGTRPHHHAYRLLSEVLGINDYNAEVLIEERPNGCLITWTATFASRIPGVGKIQQFAMRSVVTRVAAALAREAERGMPKR